MIVNDYSAELVVASTFAEAGWNIYFPHRDQGFDRDGIMLIKNGGWKNYTVNE